MTTGEHDVAAVLDAERALAAAHLTLDVGAFDRLLHPDYVIVQPGGVVEGKAATLASLRGGNRRWSEARSDQMDAQVYGNCAVVTGRWRGLGVNAGAPFDYRARFVSTWVRGDDGWRNVAYAAHEIEA